MSHLLIHIGYHRTGSTWLQTAVFNNSGPFSAPWERGHIVRDLIAVDPLRFDPEAARKSFVAGINSAKERSRVPVVTHEDLSGNPHAGGHNRKDLAERLAAAFPDARVLMVIREQKEMILSCWKQYVRIGGANSLKNYIIAPWTKWPRIPRFDFRFFEYDSLIAHYHRLFGTESLLVLPFELLRQDPHQFVLCIATFAGTTAPKRLDIAPVYQAPSGPTCEIRRRLNLIFVRASVNPAAPVYIPGLNGIMAKAVELLDPLVPLELRERWDSRAAAYVRTVVGDRYVASNRRTMELTGIDLKSYGYDS